MDYKSERQALHDAQYRQKPKHIAPAPQRKRPHFLGSISMSALIFPAVILAIILGLKLWFMLS